MDDILKQLKKPRNLVIVLIFAFAFLIIIPQLDSFKGALNTLDDGSYSYIVLSTIFTSLTYLFATGVYKSLAFRALSVGRTTIVQLAAMFINRLLPAGIGAIGVNYLYLRKNKHTKTQAASVVAINNFVGGIGHNIIFWILVFWSGYSVISARKLTNPVGYILFLGIVCIAAYLLTKLNPKIKSMAKDVLKQLKTYKNHPIRLSSALFFSILLTLANVLALFFAAKAFGIELDFAKTFIVFTLGVSGGAIIPTPGGLGGFEAGLTAGYIAFGIDKETALAVALLYRLISYWLTMLCGAGAFLVALKKKWI